jgi:hypothetical protein
MNLLSKIVLNLFFLASFFLNTKFNQVVANEKYATIVNPIRNRELWKDKTLKPLDVQYKTINDLNLKATWLIQDDVIDDKDLVEKIKKFNQDQELGLFLEISPSLANKTRIYYPTETDWSNPQNIFLSAYSVKDRKILIDKMVSNFKNTFGFLPKSAGAWWIDSWSQQYLEKKYHITIVMICADQKTTDRYGIWGQWWGYPYHPSPDNILTPGSSPTVVIQWAQRDLEKAYYGSGPFVSTFSLQANDYAVHKLNIKYFGDLSNQYLSVEKLGQITVGLETGMESVGNEAEYKNQLTWISKNQINSLKMSEFGDKYRTVYENKNPEKIILGDWTLTPEYRSNFILSEKTVYNPNISFDDKFIADQSDFLNRILSNLNNKKNINYWPLFLLIIPLLWWWSKNLIPILWLIVLYLPIFRSFYSSGWQIFFGPTFKNLIISQILILLLGGILITKINQKFKINWSSWFSVWIFNLLIFTARFSVIEGKYYLGFLLDNFRFIGISLGNGLKIINQDLVGYVAATMLKFNPSWIWGHWWSWAVAYPLIEITLVLIINKVIPKKLRVFMIFLSALFIIYLLNQNPLTVI